MNEKPLPWKVGEVARRTGLTVRTLHHYDRLGLLSPSARSPAAYRLYTAEDLARLQQIQSLRQLGLPLAEIRTCLERRGFSPAAIVQRHLRKMKEWMAQQRVLVQRLEALAESLERGGKVSVETLVKTIEEITRMEKYFTPEQKKQLEDRRKTLGEEKIRQAEADWTELIAQVRAEMEKGADPAGESMQRLARRWVELTGAFTGGDPGIGQSLSEMYRQEGPAAASRGALDGEVFAFASRAVQALKGAR